MLPDGVSIVHFIPGRVRLKVKGLRRDPQLRAWIRHQLAGIPGLLHMEINPNTEAVLINYDRRVVADPAHVDEVMVRLKRLMPDVDESVLRRWLC